MGGGSGPRRPGRRPLGVGHLQNTMANLLAQHDLGILFDLVYPRVEREGDELRAAMDEAQAERDARAQGKMPR